MRPLSILFVALSACAPPVDPPDAMDAARYFGLVDGTERSFIGPGNLEETHTIARDTTVSADREVFSLVARQGGFVEDERTLFLEATTDGLFIDRLFDCVSRCATLSEPGQLLAFPVAEGLRYESTVEVAVSENGVEQSRGDEVHRVQVGSTDASGATELVWTRDAEGDAQTTTFTFVEEEGFVGFVGDDGSAFTRSE